MCNTLEERIERYIRAMEEAGSDITLKEKITNQFVATLSPDEKRRVAQDVKAELDYRKKYSN